jgi:hypothetical protein
VPAGGRARPGVPAVSAPPDQPPPGAWRDTLVVLALLAVTLAAAWAWSMAQLAEWERAAGGP